jgi:general secretion pathway protein A
MYYEHFRLAGEPFSLTPDPAFLFLSEKHREAMAAVQYGLMNGRGFITLIGEVGTGKTTILYSVLSQLGPEAATAYVPYAAHSFDDLLTLALKDLGEQPPAGAARLQLLEVLQRMLLRRDAAGQRTALVIDEAQSLGDATFEELRLLSNFETYTHKLLQIVLVGQPELQERLRQQNLRQLQQRVSVRAIINPLDSREMEAYILHRLKQVGGDERLFEPAALRAIVRHTRGIPRRANILCHNALLFAFGRSLPLVTASTAEEAIAEMDERKPGMLGGGTLRRVSSGRAWSWRSPVGMATAAAVALAASGAMLLGGRDAGVPRGGASAAASPVAAAALAEAPSPPPVASAPAAPPPAVVAPPAPAPSPPAAVAAPPAPDPPPSAVAVAAAEKVTARAPEPGAPSSVRVVNIPPGGSILAAARELYGKLPAEMDTEALLSEVRRLNPGLRDVNLVKAGATVKFPRLTKQTESGEQPSE